MAAPKYWDDYVSIDVSGCHLWTGRRSHDGYGRFRQGLHGKERLAHRYIWEQTHGPIPTGLCILHRCDVRPCVNLEHLFLGTPADNNRDARLKGRAYRPRCRPGVQRIKTGMLGREVPRLIRQRHAAGETARALAREYGFSHSYIRKLIRGLVWPEH